MVTNQKSAPMAEQTISAEDCMEHYAEQHYEWINGELIPLSLVHARHDLLVRYLIILLDTYLESMPMGQIRQDPFVMRLPEIESRRQPDIQFIRDDNPNELKLTYMDGAADICIEIVSPASVVTDRGVKYEEYAKGGVREYWLIDPISNEARFYRLSDEGFYIAQELTGDEYQTDILPKFKLHIPTLWEKDLPKTRAIVRAVDEMIQA